MTDSTNTATTNSNRLSTTVFVTVIFVVFNAGKLVVDVNFAEEGEYAVGSEVMSTNDDARRRVD